MTICHVSSMHPAMDGRIFQRACRGIALKKNRVFLVVTNPGNEVLNGVNVIGLRSRKGLSRRLFTSFEAFRKTLKIKADIYHFHDPDLIPWMLILSVFGKKVVFDIHENYESRLNKLPRIKFIQSTSLKVYKVLETFICNRFAGIVVVTESMKNNLKKIKKPVVVINNLVYLERMKEIPLSNQKSDQITIYTSGNNTPARNCLQAVEALPYIVKKFPYIKMIFAGGYYPANYKNELMQRADELGVSGNLELLGKVDWEENFSRTSFYHIGCVFYEDNANNRVTLPNRLFEYMFCGLAVLGEDFPEVKGIINIYNCGLVVNSSSPLSIAEKVIFLLENPAKISEMGTNGRNAVLNECNYERALDSLISFYESILN